MSFLLTLILTIWGIPLAVIALAITAALLSSRARLFLRRALVTG